MPGSCFIPGGFPNKGKNSEKQRASWWVGVTTEPLLAIPAVACPAPLSFGLVCAQVKKTEPGASKKTWRPRCPSPGRPQTQTSWTEAADTEMHRERGHLGALAGSSRRAPARAGLTATHTQSGAERGARGLAGPHTRAARQQEAGVTHRVCVIDTENLYRPTHLAPLARNAREAL